MGLYLCLYRIGLGYCIRHKLSTFGYQYCYTNCNDNKYCWRFTKRVKQAENTMCLFGSGFLFAHEYGNYY